MSNTNTGINSTNTQLDAPPVKKKRIFLWTFLTVQAIFILWIVTGLSGSAGVPEDCASLSAEACNDAESVGTAIGLALVIGFWMAVDFLLAVGYVIYRLAKRP